MSRKTKCCLIIVHESIYHDNTGDNVILVIFEVVICGVVLLYCFCVGWLSSLQCTSALLATFS